MGLLRGPCLLSHQNGGSPTGVTGEERASWEIKRLCQCPQEGSGLGWLGWGPPSFSTGVLPVAPCPSLLGSLSYEVSSGAQPRGAPVEGLRAGEAQEGVLVPAPLCAPASGGLHSSTKVTAPLQEHPYTSRSLQVLLTTCRLSPSVPSRLGGIRVLLC